jgi:Protein of unknown function (DUF2971)
MALLYHYIAPGRPQGGTPSLPPQLSNLTLLAADPCSFNDPFEVRPYFDQERHDHFAKSHESFYEAAIGIKHSLRSGRSMAGIPTENAVGFGERLNKRFRDELGKRFRVLCLSRTASSALMWGHYTDSYHGFVIGLDTDHSAFPKGLKPEGFPITYSADRSRKKLPLAFYQSPHVEMYDLQGNIVNPPDQLVESDAGLLIPFKEYRRQVEEALLTALTTKAQDWHYEQEVRFIYDLSKHQGQLLAREGRHFAPIPPDALKEVIVGFRAGAAQVAELVRLYRAGRIGKPKLYYSACHPHRYEVQAHEADDKYLLDYFQIILPSQ